MVRVVRHWKVIVLVLCLMAAAALDHSIYLDTGFYP